MWILSTTVPPVAKKLNLVPMKKKQTTIDCFLAIAMTCSAYSASAQIYVHVRPVARVVVRTEPPSPRHVWVNEDWRERNGRYEDPTEDIGSPNHQQRVTNIMKAIGIIPSRGMGGTEGGWNK